MLHKIEKKVLKILNKYKNENIISIDKFKGYTGQEIHQAIQSLKDKGYLELADSSIDYMNFSYVLTTDGRYYKEKGSDFRSWMAIIISLLSLSIEFAANHKEIFDFINSLVAIFRQNP